MTNITVTSRIGTPVNGSAYLTVLKRWVMQTPILSSRQGTSAPIAGSALAFGAGADRTFRDHTAKHNLMGPPREAFQT
ncbi:MAG: hypothetical protein ACQSGP_01720 [Frankia sp.]